MELVLCCVLYGMHIYLVLPQRRHESTLGQMAYLRRRASPRTASNVMQTGHTERHNTNAPSANGALWL